MAGPAPHAIRILTNFARFPERWTLPSGEAGTARLCRSYDEFRAAARDGDLLLINGDISIVQRLALASLLPGAALPPVVAVDLVLRRPLTGRARAVAFLRRQLLRRTAHFINYFRDSEGYGRWYGITPERSSFVPFKPNLRYRVALGAEPEGRYVLCFGRSLRDYDTFFRAVAALPYPAATPRPDFAALREHGSRFTVPLSELPPNVELLDDDGSQDAMVTAIAGARMVVLPILATSMLAGNSVYLNAMLARRCVIVSAGPGVSDVLAPEAAIQVAPEDPAALAAAIRRVWEDDALRLRTAEAGYAYAASLGGEPELYARILEKAIGWYRGRRGR